MKERLMSIFFALLLLANITLPVVAAGDAPRLVDEADLLTDDEETSLLEQLDEISERQQVDVVVVTVNSLEGAGIVEYTDDFFDYNGYGFGEGRDGILFLISMEERDWYISTCGYGIMALTDAGMDYMSEKFLDDLSAGEYAAAFTVFAGLCDDFITQARMGEPYDVDNLPKEPFEFVWSLITALGIGFIISLIATGIMRSGLKTVRGQSEAGAYIKKDSMELTTENDLFLYKRVDRREKPKENESNKPVSSSGSGGSTTHTSSSGTTHGGKGGKF